MKTISNSFAAGFFTAILSMSCFFLFSFFTPANTDIKPGILTASTAISWNEAVTLKNKFKNLQPLKMETTGPNGINQVPLEGFTIQAAQLLEIIQNNKAGGQADAVMFYLGAEDPQQGFTLPKYHIIAVGVNANGLMIPANDRDKSDPGKSSVFDKADPCPPFCPGE